MGRPILGVAGLFVASMVLSGCLCFNRCGCEKTAACCCPGVPAGSVGVRPASALAPEHPAQESQPITDK